MKNSKLLKKSARFMNYASKLEPSFPQIKIDLLQSRTDLSLKEHIAISIYQSVNTTTMFVVGILILGYIIDSTTLIILSVVASPFVFIMMLYSALYRPKILTLKRARDIDSELPYALRHLLIQIKSGVPLYQALVAVTQGYGAASKEFEYIIKDINGGKSQTEAIEDSIVSNPSLSYRRSFWQLLNAMKTGTDLQQPLENIVDEILKTQLLSIKKYGQELNPWTLMYMMFAVIMPSLGITFMMILSTFTGTGIPDIVLVGVLIFLGFFQMMFMNIIKSKRPVVKI
ncbi:MAG: type II secretion system F family protein [Candidatus Aenigmarchaeota archaeon]|nr:type II secretion system F family protein [Candidatus Aenigmarchaeota archaeon]